MKKIIFLIILSFVSVFSHGQDLIKLDTKKVTLIVFDSKIKNIKGGFDPNYFAISTFDKILYIQPLTDNSFIKNNLSVVTEDDLIYLFNTSVEPTSINSYLIASTSAINYKKDNVPTSTNTKKIEEEQSGEKSSNTVNVITDSIVNDVFKSSNIFESNNGIVKDKMFLYVDGIYTTNKRIYFKVNIFNNSGITYNISGSHLSSKTRKRGKRSTQNEEFINVLGVYGEKTILPQKRTNLVIETEKFAINNDRDLALSILEQNGDRNISYIIKPNMFYKSIKIK